jgi:hypothetical protein
MQAELSVAPAFNFRNERDNRKMAPSLLLR